MKYIIKDRQFHDRFFADRTEFNSLEGVCEQLIDYHENDCDMSEEQKLLDQGNIKECIKALEMFEWEILEI